VDTGAGAVSYDFDLGPWRREITTAHPEAQLWFDRGLNWLYAYNHEEAVTCFRHALERDPGCAMAHCGVAHAGGPFYNRPWIRYADAEIEAVLPVCHAAAAQAAAHAEGCTAAERALIAAIRHRYPQEITLDRDALNRWHDAFTGEINFASGVVTGGFLSLSVTDTITTDTFDADIVAQSGQISAQADQGFFIDGLLFSGLFSGLSFAGVDVSDWFNAQPLTGSFLQFEFSPDEGGSDRDTDLDIFVIVPAPGPAAALGLALGAGALRRRR